MSRMYEHLEYTPYGELWVEEVRAGGEKTPFRFTGKRLDEETGLYYYGARYLDPQTSRWLSTDPAMGEFVSGRHRGNGGIYNVFNFNVYHYSNNNPIVYSDPDGKEPPPGKTTLEQFPHLLEDLSYVPTSANTGSKDDQI